MYIILAPYILTKALGYNTVLDMGNMGYSFNSKKIKATD